MQAAVCNGYMDCIEVLLQYSVDVDQQDMNTGCTPLHVASQWGYTDITKLLIGSFPNCANHRSRLKVLCSKTYCVTLACSRQNIKQQ